MTDLLTEARDALLATENALNSRFIDEKDRNAALRGAARKRKKVLAKLNAAIKDQDVV